MQSSSLQRVLKDHPNHQLAFILPDGGIIPRHAHITEVGRVDKTFLDCGATVRKTSFLCLQSWVADDTDHRLQAGRLSAIIDRAFPILGNNDLEVELEYEDGVISQFPLTEVEVTPQELIFRLSLKHTDCLAKEICLPKPKETSSCCTGTGCC